MNGSLRLFNRQSAKRLDLRAFRTFTHAALKHLLADDSIDLAVHFVDDDEMAAINESILGHFGTTDVITLDYSEKAAAGEPAAIVGEIFICVPEATRQARGFGVAWQEEIMRYLVHGVLHLQGHDDLKAKPRKLMKTLENRHVADLSREFPLRKLARKPKLKR